MKRDELVSRLSSVGERRREAMRIREETSAELARLVPEAHAAGVTITEIAQLTGMSRQAVYDVLGERPA